jgi:N-acetylneuraminic acid mutarotase
LKSRISILIVLGIILIAFGCKQTPISPDMKNHVTVKSNSQIFIEQGGHKTPIWPLSGLASVQDFYSYHTPDHSSANTADDLEISGTSQIFFYFDETSAALNLVIIHDRPNDGSGGRAIFDFSGLPAGATFEVEDDPSLPGSDTYSFNPPVALFKWVWGNCCTDGAAIGGLDSGFDITIDASFPPRPEDPKKHIINTWVVRNLRPNGQMELIELEMDKPLRLFTSGSGCNFKTGSWSSLTPVPALGDGIEGMSVTVIGNEIIAVGGFDNGWGDTRTTRIYDISGDSWSTGSDAPFEVAEGAGTSFGGKFYHVGGRSIMVFPEGVRNFFWMYEPTKDQWYVIAADSLTPRAGLAVAVVPFPGRGPMLCAIGGRTGINPQGLGQLDAMECFALNQLKGLKCLKGKAECDWEIFASLPEPRSDMAAAVWNGKIYIFGGFDGTGAVLNDVDVYDPKTDTWSSWPADMPTARGSFYSAAVKASRAYLIGGWERSNPPKPSLKVTEIYDFPKNKWCTGPPLTLPVAEAGIVSHGAGVYVVGGANPPAAAEPVARLEVLK